MVGLSYNLVDLYRTRTSRAALVPCLAALVVAVGLTGCEYVTPGDRTTDAPAPNDTAAVGETATRDDAEAGETTSASNLGTETLGGDATVATPDDDVTDQADAGGADDGQAGASDTSESNDADGDGSSNETTGGFVGPGTDAGPKECPGCTGKYDPVCGYDGSVYGNACEAACYGVGVAYAGLCKEAFKCAADSDCASGSVCRSGLCAPTVCTCDLTYDPVCGSDGATYTNPCFAACAGVTNTQAGACAPSSGGGTDTGGADGAACMPTTERCGDRADNDCDGLADETCDACGCPSTLSPVCADDGREYNNACLAACAGATVAYNGRCACQKTAAACSTDRPVCTSDGTTYRCGIVEALCNGRDVAFTGSCALPTPVCNRPLCPPGERAVTCEPGAAADGCPIKCSCTPIGCPAVETPTCPEGRLVPDGVNANGCTKSLKCETAFCPVIPTPFVMNRLPCDASSGDEVKLLARRDPVGCALPDTCASGCEADCDATDPVCGLDGVTYLCGVQQLMCHGSTGVAYPGACDEPCGCPAAYDPVCGFNGVTYRNLCQAMCAGVASVTEGECKARCDCPLPGAAGFVDSPVCAGGTTYANLCFARCAGYPATGVAVGVCK